MDLLNFVIKPTGSFFIGFTISGILTGLLYGFLLYKRPVRLLRIFTVTFIKVLLIDQLLNTYWLTIMYGYDYTATFTLRILKNIIMLPVETLLLFALIKGIEATGVLKAIRNKK
jgi:ECF transporter S component (folate family)